MLKPFRISQFDPQIIRQQARAAEFQMARQLLMDSEINRLSSEGKISSMSFTHDALVIECPAAEVGAIKELLENIMRSY